MLQEEVSVAEAPENRNTRQATVAGSHDINIAIAYIDGPLLPHTKLTQSSLDGIRSRFLADTLGLMLTNSHLDDVWEKMTDQFLCSRHHLITDYSQATTTFLKF